MYVGSFTFRSSRNNVRKVFPDTTHEIVIAILAEALEEIGGVLELHVKVSIKCFVDKSRT